MRRHRLWAVIGIVLGFAALPGIVWAQASTGSIDGRVFDETKAPMPGVTVTAKNIATGLTRTTTSSASGTYRLEALPAGTYDVSADLAGFATHVRKAAPVQVSSASTVDFTMKVGPEDGPPSETRVVQALEPAIRSAVEAGWDPESRGRAFRYEIAESI